MEIISLCQRITSLFFKHLFIATFPHARKFKKGAVLLPRCFYKLLTLESPVISVDKLRVNSHHSNSSLKKNKTKKNPTNENSSTICQAHEK